MFGTLYNVVFPAFSIVAAIIGSDAFLEPDMLTSPSNFFKFLPSSSISPLNFLKSPLKKPDRML